MATLDEIFTPPECVRGMTSLDKSVFKTQSDGYSSGENKPEAVFKVS